MALVCAYLLTVAAAVWLTAHGTNALLVMAPLAAVMLVSAFHRTLFSWEVLLGLLVAVIIIIPIRRYTLPSGLPFELEPYRIVVAALAGLWLAALLGEPNIRYGGSALDAPMLLLLAVLLLSIVVNSGLIVELIATQTVLKKLTFFVSFIIVAYIVATVMRRRDQIELMVKVLVVAGAFLAFFAIVESWTGVNIFNKLGKLPFLEYNPLGAPPDDLLGRGGRRRVYASAQHPISLGAAMAVLLPLAIYLAHATKRRIWWIASVTIFIGALATVSRTPFLMLVTVALVFVFFHPGDVRRLLPVGLAMLVAVNFAVPGVLGGIKSSFLPEGGVVSQQRQGGEGAGSGRVADLGPALDEWSKTPLLGQGFATHIIGNRRGINGQIFDNQWLTHLIETGALGVFALLWLFITAIRRLSVGARRDDPDGWLRTAFIASLAAFAVGMFTFDAFSFIQVTVIVFILFGLTMSLTRRELQPRTARRSWSIALPPRGDMAS